MKITIIFPKLYNISDIRNDVINKKIVNLSNSSKPMHLSQLMMLYPNSDNINIIILGKNDFILYDPDETAYIISSEFIKEIGYIVEFNSSYEFTKVYPTNKLWSDAELELLTELAPYMNALSLTHHLPARSELAIKRKISSLKIQKNDFDAIPTEIMSKYFDVTITDSKTTDFTDNNFLEKYDVRLSDYIYTGTLLDLDKEFDDISHEDIDDFHTMLEFCDSRFFIVRNYTDQDIDIVNDLDFVDYVNKEFKNSKNNTKFSDNIFVKLFALGNFNNFKLIYCSNSRSYLDDFIESCINFEEHPLLDTENILIQKKFGTLFRYGIIFNGYDKTIELLENMWRNIICIGDCYIEEEEDDMDLMFAPHTIWLNMFEYHGDDMLKFYYGINKRKVSNLLKSIFAYIFNNGYMSYNIMIFNMKSTKFLDFIFKYYNLLNKNMFLAKLLTEWAIFNNTFMIEEFALRLSTSNNKPLKVTNKLMKKIGITKTYDSFAPIFKSGRYKFKDNKKLVDVSKMSTMLINGRFTRNYLEFLLDMIINDTIYYSLRYAELVITITEVLQPFCTENFSSLNQKLSDTLKYLEYENSDMDEYSE